MLVSKMKKYIKVNKRPVMKKVLVFDVHNLIYRTLYISIINNPDDPSYNYWRYLMVNSIFTQIKMFTPDRVIFAIDCKHNWRKKIYKDYKGQRKAARDKSVIDFDKFYPIMDDFLKGFKEVFTNIFCLEVDDCEADDIMAVLARETMEEWEMTIISTDKDLIQLLKMKNIKLYTPIKKKFVESINPQMDLDMKIVVGDKSDNIPPIKSRCGKKTAEKMIREGLDVYLNNPDIKKQFDINKTLIDFDFIPKYIIKGIRKQFDEYNITPLDGFAVFQWLIKNRNQRFMDDLQIYSPFLKHLS